MCLCNRLILKGFERVGELYDPSYRWSKLLLRGFEGLESSTALHISGYKWNKFLLRGFEGNKLLLRGLEVGRTNSFLRGLGEVSEPFM